MILWLTPLLLTIVTLKSKKELKEAENKEEESKEMEKKNY